MHGFCTYQSFTCEKEPGVARKLMASVDGGDGRVIRLDDPQRQAVRKGDIVLVPGAQAPMWPLNLPAGLKGHAREQVARRQVQDRVGPGETLDIRPCNVGVSARSRWTRVLVADPQDVAKWKASAPGAQAILPDYLALPTAPDLWTLESRAEGLCARLGPGDGFAAGPDVSTLLLRDALQERPPKAVLLSGVLSQDLAALFADADVPLVENENALSQYGIAAPKVLAHGELSCDLRQDAALALRQMRARVMPWLWAGMAAICAAISWSVLVTLETQRLTEAAAAERQVAISLVREHFLPVGPILDVRAQVNAVMAGRKAAARAQDEGVRPLDILATAAVVLNGMNATTEEIGFETADGLRIWARVPDFAALDALVSAFTSARLTVELLDARAAEDASGVRAELLIAQSDGDGADG